MGHTLSDILNSLGHYKKEQYICHMQQCISKCKNIQYISYSVCASMMSCGETSELQPQEDISRGTWNVSEILHLIGYIILFGGN